MTNTPAQTQPKAELTDAEQLVEMIGEPDLALFFLAWVKNEFNAQASYKELHPTVTMGSAAVLGSRELKKVNREIIMSAMNLGHDRYFKQLSKGLDATKWNDFTGEREADHQVRRPYHDKLGKILGIEQDKPSTLVQVNGTEMSLEFIGGESK